MRGHFRRRIRPTPAIPTTSMPDIVFLLLIFFMVSSVLRRTEVQVRTTLPTAEATAKIDQKRLVSHVFIGPVLTTAGRRGPTRVQVDDVMIDDISLIRDIMARKLRDQPRLVVSLRIDETAEMGVVADVQRELRLAGALRVNYAARRSLTGAATSPGR